MRALILALMLTPLSVFAQDLPRNETGRIEYTEVVKVDSANAAILYSNAKIFIAKSFKSAKNVTDLSDENSKTVIIKGNMPVSVRSMGSFWDYGVVWFQISIQCKDGRYKYSITDFVHEDKPGPRGANGGSLESEKPECGTLKLPKKYWEYIKTDADQTTKTLIADMKKAMVPTGDNW